MSKTKPKTEANFESLLGELNTIITDMEKGNQPLEQALQDFERGVKLIRDCQKVLKNAEQQVKILLENKGDTTSQFELKKQ